jgi:uncharacterized protein YkwD
VRGYVVALTAAGLILGQAVATGAAQATAPAGKRHIAADSNSVNIDISGVTKARVKIKGSGLQKVVRASTVLQVPVGTYRVRAFPVKDSGQAYRPAHRSFRLRATGGRSFIVAVQYKAVSGPGVGAPQTTVAPVPDGPIATMFALVNEARSQKQVCGAKTMPAVAPVTYDGELSKAAQLHAEDMAAKNYFDHDSLDGRSFIDRIEATGFTGSPGGENIASGFPTAQATLQGWLNSPGHCVNLMDPDFDVMGLGVADRSDPKFSMPVTYWVQDFGYSR